MGFFLLVALAIALFALRRAMTAEQTLVAQRRELLELRRMVQTLADRLGERWPGEQAPHAPHAAQQAAASTAAATDSRVVEQPVTPAVPAVTPAPVDPQPFTQPSPLDSRAPLDPLAPPETVGAPTDGQPHGASAGPPPIPPIVPSPSPLPRLRSAARTVADADSLESAIGGRWLLYIGIAAIVLGASYFLKYAFDNDWIGEHTRVIFGVIGGVALTLLGRRFVQRGYELYGQVLCGGGLGVIYLTIYAAHAWYGLIGGSFAFAAMLVTTVITAALADQQRSQAMALFAVIVGFATPFLIGSERENHVGLFTYDAVLVAGTLFLARRREWPALNLVSYVLTVMTFAAWADHAYRPAYYVSVQFFLTLYVVLFLAILRENRRVNTPAAKLATMMLALAPVLYHFASLVNLRPRIGPLLVYLIAFTVAGIILAGQTESGAAAAAPRGAGGAIGNDASIGSGATAIGAGGAPSANPRRGESVYPFSPMSGRGRGEGSGDRAAWIRVLVFTGVALPFWGLAQRGFPRGWVIAAWITLLAIYFTHLIAQVNALTDDAEPADAASASAATPAAPASGAFDAAASAPGVTTIATSEVAANITGTSDDAAFSQPASAQPASAQPSFAQPAATQPPSGYQAIGAPPAMPSSAAAAPPFWQWRLPAPEILLLHANGFWLLFCVQALFAPRALAWSAPIAFGLAAWYGVLAFIARSWHRDVALHTTALASAFAAIGFAIQFNGPWLVVALAAEGAVLVWLAIQSSRTWVRMWGNLLLLLAVFRALALLQEPVPIGYWPLLNPRTLSCFFIVGILYAIAWMHARDPFLRTQPVNRHTLVILANILTLVVLSAEVTAYFDRQAWAGGVGAVEGQGGSAGSGNPYGLERVPGGGAGGDTAGGTAGVPGAAAVENSAALSRQLALSSLWALYAVVLVAVGIWRDYRPIRYLAMVIFGFTITKVFFVDIATLDRVYKMLSVMVLGVLLLVASYLYQRLKSPQDPADNPAES